MQGNVLLLTPSWHSFHPPPTAPAGRETAASTASAHRGQRGPHLVLLLVPPILLSPGAEECGKQARAVLKGEVGNSQLFSPAPNTGSCILCPMSSCISPAFAWKPTSSRHLSPRGLSPVLAGTCPLLFVLPQTSWNTWKRGANVENSRHASWLQRMGRRRGRSRSTAGTCRSTVGAEELNVRFGDFLEGLNEPTGSVRALLNQCLQSPGQAQLFLCVPGQSLLEETRQTHLGVEGVVI